MNEEDKYLLNYLNYDDLKSEALEYIKKIGYNKWNYFGENDPGITILENLIFAIIDIDYKILFPIEDILAKNPNKSNEIKNFYLPDEILPMCPVCLNDYYKIILDTDGIVNCRVIPIKKEGKVSGCYDVYLYIEPNEEINVEKVKENVFLNLYKYRNLCEDFNSITLFEIVEVFIEVKLELSPDFISGSNYCENIISLVLTNVQNLFVPKIQFSTLSELLVNKGVSLDKIYEGPLLNHGFITDEALLNNKLKNRIFIIDIIDLILKQEFVDNIQSFKIKNSKTGQIYLNHINLNDNQAIRVNFKKSSIKILINGINIKYDKDKAIMIAKRRYLFLIKNNVVNDEEIGTYEGRYRNLLDYSSLQNDFPMIYGVGYEGISNTEKEENVKQNHQLRCFILLFDQLLYIYHTVLENIKAYYSIDNSDSNIISDKLPPNIKNLKDLIKKPTNNSDNPYSDVFCIQRKYILRSEIEVNSSLFKACNNYISLLNKNTLLSTKESTVDYLLSLFFNYRIRSNNYFNWNYENKKKYISCCCKIESNRCKAFELYSNMPWEGSNLSGLEKKLGVYWNIKNINRRFLYKQYEDNFKQWNSFTDLYKMDQDNYNHRFMYKAKYENIIDLVLYYGNNRSNYLIFKNKSFSINNFKEEETDVLEIRILINGEKNRYISIVPNDGILSSHSMAQEIIDTSLKKINKFNIEAEGFHLIENILLRPSDCKFYEEDLYSCRLTLVFPSWPARFQDIEFRNSMKDWIKYISPAHIKTDILWLNFEDMRIFETISIEWYNKKNNRNTTVEEQNSINRKFIDIIISLKSKYGNLSKNEEEKLYNVFSDPIT